MNVLIIDHERRIESLTKTFFPAEWHIDYNVVNSNEYDLLLMDCDVCKLDDDIAWSHWCRDSDHGTPKQELKDEHLQRRTWGSSQRYAQIYDRLFQQLQPLDIKKTILLDVGDRAVVSSGLSWLDARGYHVDVVLKREYRRTHLWDYSSRVKPFPFLTFDGKACNVLYSADTATEHNKAARGCFFIGDPLLRVELGMSDEWVNRYDMLIAMERIGSINWLKNRLEKNEYLNLFKSHRSFLHLNGTGHLCGRFFEGLGMGCLCVMQETDLVFPMASPVHPSLIFRTPEQAKQIIEKIDTDDEYYSMCIEYQRQMIKTWFNRDKIGSYLLECLYA